MAVLPNSVLAADTVAALDIEFINRFNGDVNQLMRIFGITTPEVRAAGTTLYQYTVTGALNNSATSGTPSPSSSGTAYVEGDEVALSKYAVTKTPVGSLEFRPYRKLTSLAAIQKGGVENAIMREDKQMLKDIRAALVTQFFGSTGLGTTTGITTVSNSYTVNNIQSALAYARATLDDALETNADSAERVIYFVNPFDIADQLAKSTVSVQTAFGMDYVESFLGVQNIFITNKVAAHTVLATPAENIRLYGIDFGSAAQAGLGYTTSENGLIGVNHEADYSRVSAITNVIVGMNMMIEKPAYIVKATITPSA